jgi:5S rRNA maturation endonuclease (ribonuclease M5)
MNLIQASVETFLPAKRKITPSGWISFNAVCCHHNGDSQDTRKRGGILFNNEGFQYHCFNCGFKAGWTPGKLLSKNTKNFFSWMGMPSEEINKLNLEALRSKEDRPVAKPSINFHQEPRALPGDCRPILDWLEQEPTDEVLAVVDYLSSREMDLSWYNWMWSSENGYRDRVIIPFYQDGVVVGFTGRKIKPGKPKYLTDSQSGYVFNIDRQTLDKEYTIVVEGQFDAIAVDGVAIMTNEPNATQIARINRLGKKVIVVPDKDKPGAKLIEHALEQGWSVSIPQWEDDVKDAAKAVEKYGRIYTLYSILHYVETNETKIKLYQKKLENINDNET